MTNEQLVEQIARTIALAEYDGNEAFLEFARPHSKAGKKRLALQARAILPIILAAREEGARAMQDACAKDAATWFPAGSESKYPASGVVASIRALDPAKIAGGSDAEAD